MIVFAYFCATMGALSLLVCAGLIVAIAVERGRVRGAHELKRRGNYERMKRDRFIDSRHGHRREIG